MRYLKILLTYSLLFFLPFISCENPSSGSDDDKSDEDNGDDMPVYSLSGVTEGKEVLVFLEAGEETDDATYQGQSVTVSAMSGFLVYDGRTIDLNGSLIKENGSFSVSSCGVYNNTRLNCSIYGYILSEEVVYSNMNLTVLYNDDFTMSHQLFLSETDKTITPTDIRYVLQEEDFPFHGWWYETGLTSKEVQLRLSSDCYFYAANGIGGKKTDNGLLLMTEKDEARSSATESVWSFIYLSDTNEIDEFDEGSSLEAYPITYGKASYTDDSSTMYLAFPEEDHYYLTTHDLYQLSQGTSVSHGGDPVIENVIYTSGNPSSSTVKTLEEMRALARNFAFPADKAAPSATHDIIPFQRL